MAYGAYHFWTRKDSVAQGLSAVVHKVEDAALNVVHKVEDVVTAVKKGYIQKLKPAKERVEEFKKLHLQKFVEAKEAAIKEDKERVLAYETLKKLQQLAIEMSEKDFRKITKLCREQRRKCLDHEKPKYEEIFIEFETDFEELFTQNLKTILAESGVSDEKYNSSIEAYVQKDQEVYLNGIQLYDVMIGRLPCINEPVPPTKEYVTEIHAFMLSEYKHTFYKPVSKEYFTDVKEKMVLDKVWEKYGIEEEDLRKLRRTFDTPEIDLLQEQFNTLIAQDEQKYGNFPTQ